MSPGHVSVPLQRNKPQSICSTRTTSNATRKFRQPEAVRIDAPSVEPFSTSIDFKMFPRPRTGSIPSDSIFNPPVPHAIQGEAATFNRLSPISGGNREMTLANAQGTTTTRPAGMHAEGVTLYRKLGSFSFARTYRPLSPIPRITVATSKYSGRISAA